MSGSVLYLGDDNLSGAASYLAGVMTHHRIPFDYISSGEKFDPYLLEGEYSALVFSDYPARNFSTGDLEGISGIVREGTGILMIGGWDSFAGPGGGYQGTILKTVLPVAMEEKDDRYNSSGPCLLYKSKTHSITEGLPFETNAPTIGGYNKLTSKPGTEVLLEAVTFRAMEKNDGFSFAEIARAPILIAGSFGRGRTLAFASDVAPHWVGGLVDWGDGRVSAKSPAGVSAEVGNWYARFFANMILWATGESYEER